MTSDRYTGTARCPHCDDVHWFDAELLFFNRHEWPANVFAKGVAVAISLTRGELDAIDRYHTWLRIREPVDDERCYLLDVDGARACDCGSRLVPLLAFRIAYDVPTPIGPTDHRRSRATLLDIELHAIGSALVDRIDYAAMAPANFVLETPHLAELARGPREHRFSNAMTSAETMLGFVEDVARYRHVAGPTRCGTCDQMRERRFAMPVEYTFRIDRWSGTSLFLGARLEVDRRFLDEDCDDTNHLRVHHPVGSSTITVLELPRRSGCACGIGRGSPVMRFQRHPNALELIELELRVVRGARDLDDIDFVATRGGVRTVHRSRLKALEDAIQQFER